ncbi:uncharacterized protein [Dysidea avara]|uniref:uncharacterized protein isoform X2 n=1 Tax=Dysidea avara TaxID=196820 RepID=UPI0033178C63
MAGKARDNDDSSDDEDVPSPPSYCKGDTLGDDSKKGKGKSPITKPPVGDDSAKGKEKAPISKSPVKQNEPTTSDVDPYGGSTDDEGVLLRSTLRMSSIDSDGGGDTEDEIRRKFGRATRSSGAKLE